MAELTNFQELLKELRLPSSMKIPQGWTQVQALQNWLEAIENDKFATFKKVRKPVSESVIVY